FEVADADLRIECSSGTYVRSLVRDIGEDLGCGAVMTRLLRTRIGAFHLKHASAPHDLTMKSVLDTLRPISDALQELPALQVPVERMEDVRHGRVIDASCINRPLPAGADFALIDDSGQVYAVASTDRFGRTQHPHTVL